VNHKLLTELVLISLGFLIFSVVHSLFSSFWLKKKLMSMFPGLAPLYRLIFNVAQTLSFFILLALIPKPMQLIWQLEGIWFLLLRFIQFSMLFLLIGSFRQFNTGEFLGLSLARKWLKARKEKSELLINETGDETYQLNESGFYRVVRHPVYLFTIVLFLADPVMRLFQLCLVFWLILYFYTGSVFEERRLLQIHGNHYRNYQKQVSRLLPVKWVLETVKQIFHRH